MLFLYHMTSGKLPSHFEWGVWMHQDCGGEAACRPVWQRSGRLRAGPQPQRSAGLAPLSWR